MRHPVDELSEVIAGVEARLAARPLDARLRYRLGVLLLAKQEWTGDAKALAAARRELARAVALDGRQARWHAALGHGHDRARGGTAQALACLREAHRLDRKNRVLEAYYLTLLAESGPARTALAAIKAAAPRHRVDLRALQRDLAAAGMPRDAKALLQGFIHARNFFRSSLAGETERLLNALRPGRARLLAAEEERRCAEDQRQLARSFDAAGVPSSLRTLASLARRYGVGDDFCRPHLLARLPKAKRAALVRSVDRHAAAIQAWLDGFRGRSMPAEAAAFMYLALGAEELRERRPGR